MQQASCHHDKRNEKTKTHEMLKEVRLQSFKILLSHHFELRNNFLQTTIKPNLLL